MRLLHCSLLAVVLISSSLALAQTPNPQHPPQFLLRRQIQQRRLQPPNSPIQFPPEPRSFCNCVALSTPRAPKLATVSISPPPFLS
jgi:hypothetical protein